MPGNDPDDLRQLNRFKARTAKVGIDHVHGLRHRCAQTRCADVTGRLSPAAGGPTSKQLSVDQKRMDLT